MKTTLLSIAAFLALTTAKAQYSENFESTQSTLTSNCWSFNNVFQTTTSGEVISGTASLYTNPPVSGAGTRDMMSPALNVTGTSLTVSFKYKLSAALNGSATRSIEIGLQNVNGVFTSLNTIHLNRFTPVTVQTYNQAHAVTAGQYKLVLKISGSADGNSRMILDDLYASASALYGTGTCNSAPVAVDDIYFGIIGANVSGNVIANDNEPNGETMTAAMVATSPDGTVTMNANGSFTFVPNPGFVGATTTFTYQLTDNGFAPLTSNVATVTINFGTTIILPVKLSSFTAQLNSSNKANLKWSTASETNSSHFVVERSTDGRNYTDVATVFAAGNSSENKNYSFNDVVTINEGSIMYYRLRSVDADGRADYSAVRILRSNKSNNKITILTYPNPVSGELRITIPGNWQGKKATFEIINAAGQVSRRMDVNSSSQTETVNLTSVAPGVYVVKVTCNGETAQQMIVKK